MKEKLDSILRTISEAQRQLQEVKNFDNEGDGDGDGHSTLEEVEMGLEWIKRKLDKLKENSDGQLT